MYTFTVKNNGADVDIIITRAMLALGAIASFVYRNDDHYYLNLALSALLLIAAVFIRVLFIKFRINRLILLTAAAIILFIATRSIGFALILLLYGYFFKFFIPAARNTGFRQRYYYQEAFFKPRLPVE